MAQHNRQYRKRGLLIRELAYPVGLDFSLLVAITKKNGNIYRFFGNLWWHTDKRSDRISSIDEVRKTSEKVAHTDHDPSSPLGHDVISRDDPKGLHIDIHEPTSKEYASTILLRSKEYPPNNAGEALTQATNYMRNHTQWLLEVYMGKRSGVNPPGSAIQY